MCDCRGANFVAGLFTSVLTFAFGIALMQAYSALLCVLQVGYCQGMNFVAGLLLMYLPERHAFGGLVVLMQDRGLRKYYSTDMSLLQVCGVVLLFVGGAGRGLCRAAGGIYSSRAV